MAHFDEFRKIGILRNQAFRSVLQISRHLIQTKFDCRKMSKLKPRPKKIFPQPAAGPIFFKLPENVAYSEYAVKLYLVRYESHEIQNIL